VLSNHLNEMVYSPGTSDTTPVRLNYLIESVYSPGVRGTTPVRLSYVIKRVYSPGVGGSIGGFDISTNTFFFASFASATRLLVYTSNTEHEEKKWKSCSSENDRMYHARSFESKLDFS
jgi:hypothetical protein